MFCAFSVIFRDLGQKGAWFTGMLNLVPLCNPPSLLDKSFLPPHHRCHHPKGNSFILACYQELLVLGTFSDASGVFGAEKAV